MSLLVYDGQKLYADRFIRVHEFADVYRIEEGPKLWVQNQFCVAAVLGHQPDECDLADVTFCISTTIFLLESEGELRFYDNDLPNMRAKCFPAFSTTWFVLTNKGLYRLQGEQVFTMSNDIEFADGSGQTLYNIARQAGMTVHEAYQEVCMIERTVGAGVDWYDRNKLTNIKEWMDSPETKARVEARKKKKEEAAQ